jgi:hypothetical protein
MAHSGHRLVHCTCLLMTQSGHRAWLRSVAACVPFLTRCQVVTCYDFHIAPGWEPDPFQGRVMANITMLDIEELRKTKLRAYIDKCLEHRAPDPGFHAIMGHNIDLCEAMFVAWDACFNKGRIPHTIKEVIRVQLSRMATCSY